jgi:hypothetical protein
MRGHLQNILTQISSFCSVSIGCCHYWGSRPLCQLQVQLSSWPQQHPTGAALNASPSHPTVSPLPSYVCDTHHIPLRKRLAIEVSRVYSLPPVLTIVCLRLICSGLMCEQGETKGAAISTGRTQHPPSYLIGITPNAPLRYHRLDTQPPPIHGRNAGFHLRHDTSPQCMPILPLLSSGRHNAQCPPFHPIGVIPNVPSLPSHWCDTQLIHSIRLA